MLVGDQMHGIIHLFTVITSDVEWIVVELGVPNSSDVPQSLERCVELDWKSLGAERGTFDQSLDQFLVLELRLGDGSSDIAQVVYVYILCVVCDLH